MANHGREKNAIYSLCQHLISGFHFAPREDNPAWCTCGLFVFFRDILLRSRDPHLAARGQNSNTKTSFCVSTNAFETAMKRQINMNSSHVQKKGIGYAKKKHVPFTFKKCVFFFQMCQRWSCDAAKNVPINKKTTEVMHWRLVTIGHPGWNKAWPPGMVIYPLVNIQKAIENGYL